MIIDLSHAMNSLDNNSSISIDLPQYYEIDSSCQFIVKVELEKITLEYLNFMFSSSEQLNLLDKNEILDKFAPFTGLNLFTYEENEFEEMIAYFNNKKISFTYFSKLSNGDELFKLLSSIKEKNSFIDISILALLSKDNPQLIQLIEKLIERYKNCNFVIRENFVSDALELFAPYFFCKKHISHIIDMDKPQKKIVTGDDNVVKITNLSDNEFNSLIKTLNSNLFGHDKFKKRFKEQMEDFRILNKGGLKKIFSILLLGDSGLGKTEFARIINDKLNSDSPIIKINFGNYSSDNSLNSLIGSPRGYIGSEEGELSIKLNKSKSGIILCDEFEKSNPQIFNFFLELLEEGKFTDSQSHIYDLDGYLVVFTTNLNIEEFQKILPNELKSRIDYVSKFSPLTDLEKQKFVKYQFNMLIEKFKEFEEFSVNIQKLQKINLMEEINVNNINIREIKRIVHDLVLKRIKMFK